jgi:serine phosphatase RsbU (regulator of sigma subunit)
MDAVLVKFNNKNSLFGLSYASANNKPLLVRENHIIELPFDKMPVGKGIREDSFSLHIPELKKSDLIYFYSDGYSDQIGGPKGKKFKYGQLKELLLSISDLTMKEQKEKISETFYNWKGESEQVDDVCIIGIKI